MRAFVEKHTCLDQVTDIAKRRSYFGLRAIISRVITIVFVRFLAADLLDFEGGGVGFDAEKPDDCLLAMTDGA